MTYRADKPPTALSPEELRARIPGWGVDLDPRDRPAVPRLQRELDTDAPWVAPERQPERWPRERSIEHLMLPPVFGTTCPPKGLSGVIRRFSYARYSEGRAAHWLLLLAADRVDAVESHMASLLPFRPDNPLPETGIRSERTPHGLRSRLGAKPTDVVHQTLDPLIVAGPWVIAVGATAIGARAVTHRVRRLVHRN